MQYEVAWPRAGGSARRPLAQKGLGRRGTPEPSRQRSPTPPGWGPWC